MVSKQGISNKTRSYKSMVKNYWTSPQLSPKEHKEMIKIALQTLSNIDKQHKA